MATGKKRIPIRKGDPRTSAADVDTGAPIKTKARTPLKEKVKKEVSAGKAAKSGKARIKISALTPKQKQAKRISDGAPVSTDANGIITITENGKKVVIGKKL